MADITTLPQLKSVPSSVSLKQNYKVYKLRWGVLMATIMLNISCGAIWINNFPVATTVADYYGRDTKDVNWFSSLFFLGALPFTFVGAHIAHKYGLKILLNSASVLNFLSALIRAIATSGLFENKNTQFYVGIFGQCFGAAANSFFLGIPPKVSQKWFPDSERGLATTIGSMARPLGVIITQISVPAIVKEADDVPLNNYIWFGPCALAQILTMIFVRREDPKTPPSKSALPRHTEKPQFRSQLKDIVSNGAFINLFFCVGAGIGIVFTFGTLTQQLLCPLGYTETFSGILNGLLLFGGFVGAGVATAVMKRTRDHIILLRIGFAAAFILLIVYMQLYLIPGQEIALSIFGFSFGFFGMGLLPLSLELGVECTYPAEESISGTFIYMSGQIQALICILLIPAIAREKDDTSLSTCWPSLPYDYTIPLLIVAALMTLSCLSLIYFFDTEYKRRDHEEQEHDLDMLQVSTIETF